MIIIIISIIVIIIIIIIITIIATTTPHNEFHIVLTKPPPLWFPAQIGVLALVRAADDLPPLAGSLGEARLGFVALARRETGAKRSLAGAAAALW